MKSRYIPILTMLMLIISGLIAIGVGAAILLIPVLFHSTSGIVLGDNISLLNETRATGGYLLASGLLILSGAFVARLTFTSLLISTLLYFTYGLSRILSMILDGIPSETLVIATILEIIIGLASIYAFIKSPSPPAFPRAGF